MIYWKKVDAGDFKTYSKKFLEYRINYPNSFFNRTAFWSELKFDRIDEAFNLIPELKDGLSKYGKIKCISMINVAHPNRECIHVDHNFDTNRDVKARLQIPILNTEGTKTSFFKMTDEQYADHVGRKDETLRWSKKYDELLEPVTAVEIIQPTIIRTSVPHRVIYFEGNKFPRIAMSISFEDDIVKYLDEV